MENQVNSLIKWYLKNKRELPWRNTKDPYKIWLSEIILQQTRVAQGLPYYEKFITRYPTVLSLANAADDEVMKLWQGLGYYSRARNLLSAARFIRDELQGNFPNTITAIRQLKGVGDYTAAAIGSFAFQLKQPVLDGNVYRFITRLYGIETPINKSVTKKTVLIVLNSWIEQTNKPAEFNQALMEFGALHCTVAQPKCESCPFLDQCYAFKENKIQLLPVKSKSAPIRSRHFNYFVFNTAKGVTYLSKRIAGDIWQDLYEFPLIETTKPLTIPMLQKNQVFIEWTKNSGITMLKKTKPVLHKLTHQHLLVTFFIVDISKFLNLKKTSIFEIEINTINSFAVPRVIEKFLHSIIFKSY